MEKGFTITYEYGDNLYVNPTNRCNFNCAFCLRHNQGSGGSIYTHNLWLKREPTKEEILSSIESHDLSQYKQLVFVGFGEPTYRFDDICWVIDQMQAMKDFTREVLKYVPTVMMTVVDTIPKEEIENCRKICEEEIGATYRVREYIAD